MIFNFSTKLTKIMYFFMKFDIYLLLSTFYYLIFYSRKHDKHFVYKFSCFTITLRSQNGKKYINFMNFK